MRRRAADPLIAPAWKPDAPLEAPVGKFEPMNHGGQQFGW